mgnify:CR=1 FL=1
MNMIPVCNINYGPGPHWGTVRKQCPQMRDGVYFKSCVLPYTYSVYDAITSDHYRAGGTAGVAPGSAA